MTRAPDAKADDARVLQNLRALSVRGSAISLVSHTLNMAMQIGGSIVLSRILLPSDFGLVGLAAIFAGYAASIRDAGLGEATVQARDLDHEQLSTLYWLALGASVASALLVVAVAPLVARVYDTPALVTVMAIIAFSVFIQGFGNQYAAVMRRRMQLGRIALATLAARAMALTAAILAALGGTGYWALAIQSVVAAVALSVLLAVLSPWQPSLRLNLGRVWSRIVFGVTHLGSRVINVVVSSLDRAIVGKLSGTEVLGTYQKAWELLLLPLLLINQGLAAVALPALSKLHGERDSERYSRYFARLLGLVAFLAVPITCATAATCDMAIPMILGEKWLPAVPVFFVLCFRGALLPVGSMSGIIFLSQGRVREGLRWNVIEATARVAAMTIGAFHGHLGIALATVIEAWLLFPFYVRYLCSTGPVRQGLIYAPAAASLVALLASLAVAHFAKPALLAVAAPWPALIALAALSTVTALVVLTIARTIGAVQFGLGDLLAMLRERKR